MYNKHILIFCVFAERQFMNDREKDKQEISVSVIQILRILRRNLIPIILITVIVGAGAFLITKNFVKPKYKASALIYVQSKDYDQAATGITTSDLSIAQRLANTYSIILRTDDVLEGVVETLHDESLTTGKIKGSLTAEPMDNTEIFTINYVDTDPVRATKVVNAVAEIAPREIMNVVKAGTAKVIQVQANPPKSPISPHIYRITGVAALIALALSSLVFILISVLDTRIRSVEDLSETFNLPVFGSIPTISTDSAIAEKEESDDE